MARTTKTPHKVSRNKSGSPIVRASKLFPGRPKRTTRELAFETEQQARLFADALNLAAIRDGDWRWLKYEDWTAQLRYVDEVLCMIAEQAVEAPIAEGHPEDVNVTADDRRRGSVASVSGMSMGWSPPLTSTSLLGNSSCHLYASSRLIGTVFDTRRTHGLWPCDPEGLCRSSDGKQW
jgi:hypothetical protein